MQDKFKSALLKSMGGKSEDKAAANPPSTKSMVMSFAKRRDELESKRKQEQDIQKEDKNRAIKQNRMKDQVQAAFQSKIKEEKAER